MLSIRPVAFEAIQSFLVDFQKKSKCFEFPPDSGEVIGIFLDTTLIGYFITQCYGTDVEINQGYLRREYRHAQLSKDCTTLLEEACKKAGYKRMLLGTHNRFKSYLKFAKDLGYKPEHLVFSKEI